MNQDNLSPDLQVHVDMLAIDLQQEYRLTANERCAVVVAASTRYRKLDEQTRSNECYTRILLADSMRRTANNLYRAVQRYRSGGKHGR